MTSINSSWDYFRNDTHYSDVLKERLVGGVEMDSAKAMAYYIDQHFRGDLNILDFGGGPGHYYPIIKRQYSHGGVRYKSVDIDASNVKFGSEHFRSDPYIELQLGSVLDPEESYTGQNCIVSANTLPHVPNVEPLFRFLSSPASENVRYFIFRMLVGEECVQIKKHLRANDFDGMFERQFQCNNIYSMKYLTYLLGPGWKVTEAPDVFDVERLKQHRLPAQDSDPFYSNRVSRAVGGMIFKGDIYMPWKFVVGFRAI
jgi:hypothetical protein